MKEAKKKIARMRFVDPTTYLPDTATVSTLQSIMSNIDGYVILWKKLENFGFTEVNLRYSILQGCIYFFCICFLVKIEIFTTFWSLKFKTAPFDRSWISHNFFVIFAFSIIEWVKPWNGVKNQYSNFDIYFVYLWSTLKKKVVCRKCMHVCLFWVNSLLSNFLMI